MYMTENEAKGKECPQTMTASGGGYCHVSGCMAWRWQPLLADDQFIAAVKKRMDTSNDLHPAAARYVTGHRAEFGLPTVPFRGFCGLGGKPEA